MSATIIRNGRVIDPANKRGEGADLFIVDGKIADMHLVQDGVHILFQRDKTIRRPSFGIGCPGIVNQTPAGIG